MSFYLFFQLQEKTKWFPALASEREDIAKTRKPALVSVLDVDNSFDTDLTADEQRSLRSQGSFYADFDAADIGEAIQQFQVFLINLKSQGVKLEQLKLFCTGKKGFHIEVPPQVFMGKVPTTGVLHLPHIYREMAHTMYVDTLDLRVYSSRRMWRCPNVKREDNGKYKVQITVEEAESITPETYAAICASPRSNLPLEAPTLNSYLGLLYAQARDKVEKGVAKRKLKKAQPNQLEKFKGEWPETFEGILQGVTIRPEVGWNMVSMQLAITASALGKTEEQLLADAEGVISTHESDSTRYNTPAKRKADLRSMYRYCHENVTLEYSVGAIMSILLPEVRANADIAFGEYVPDAPAEPKVAVADAPKTEELNPGVRTSSKGIFGRVEDDYKNICDLGITDQTIMAQTNGEQIGYELLATLDGKQVGKRFLPMTALSSKANFNNWTLVSGASMRGTDQHVAILADNLRKGSPDKIFAVSREGLDVVTPPGADNLGALDVLWAQTDNVTCLREGVHYRHHSIHSSTPTYNTDLMQAPELSTDDRDYIHNLFSINTPTNLAKLIGWFSAAFLTQLIRKRFAKFPSLQVYGQAGAGKSATIVLLSHLHYYMQTPKTFSAGGQTVFPIVSAVAASASIPLVIEEVKARELPTTMLKFLKGILRSNYTADSIGRGGVRNDSTAKGLIVTDYSNAAPMCFVGESLEDQAAILERCVCVALSKADKAGAKKAEQFKVCERDATTMGKIGKAMALNCLAIDMEWLTARVDANVDAVQKGVNDADSGKSARPAFNLAVILTGLDFLQGTLQRVFGWTFDAKLEEMKASILNNVMDNIPTNMSEASRVLDTMARLTRSTDDEVRLEYGVDYTLADDGSTMDLKLNLAYDKYVKYQRGLGLEVLFDSHNAWKSAMTSYGGTRSRSCVDNNLLYDSPRALIYRLDNAFMEKEGIDSFKEK